RPDGQRPESARGKTVEHLVQLGEILGEIHGVGARSRSVVRRVDALVAALGPELYVLREAPLDDVTRVGGDVLGEAIRRLRSGDVRRTAGFDGEYGVIRLFNPGELEATTSDALFDLPVTTPAPRSRSARPTASPPSRPQPPAPPPPPPHPTPPPASPHPPSSPPRAPPPRHSGRPPPPAQPGGPAPAGPRPRPAPGRAPRGAPPPPPAAPPPEPFEPMLTGMEEVGTGLLDR